MKREEWNNELAAQIRDPRRIVCILQMDFRFYGTLSVSLFFTGIFWTSSPISRLTRMVFEVLVLRKKRKSLLQFRQGEQRKRIEIERSGVDHIFKEEAYRGLGKSRGLVNS